MSDRSTPPSHSLAFFEAAMAAFDAAAGLAGIDEHFVSIARRTVRLRGAGPALVRRLLPAIAHLQVPLKKAPAGVDLTIDVWDADSTKVALPRPPWFGPGGPPRMEVYGHHADRVETSFASDTGIMSLIDHERRRALVYAPSARELPFYVPASPFRAIISWWMRAARCVSVHAAAVGTEAGGALLAGRGGSGKSTTALACLGSELRYAGDDYVLIAPSDPPFVHSLYNSAKLEADNLHARLPHLYPLLDNPGRLHEEKGVVYLHRHLPQTLSTGFPIRVLLLPRVTSRRTPRLQRTSTAAGLLSLAPSSLLSLPGSGAREFSALAGLLRGLPVYVLELGADVSALPDLIAEAVTA